MFEWLARPLKCKFGGHDLMKSIERPDAKRAVILTLCTRCDWKSSGVEIALINGKLSPMKSKPVDPYQVDHKINHEVKRFCQICDEYRIVLPQIFRCVYCKGILVD